MKNFISTLITITLLSSCKSTVITPHALTNISDEIQVNINLNDIRNDKVLVTINTPTIFSDTITFSLPKMVPGTYSEDNYGKFIDDLKAYDKKGHLLLTHKTDENSWVISNSKTLDKITYFVNDTFDIEKNVVIDSDDVFFSYDGIGFVRLVDNLLKPIMGHDG